MKKSETVDTVVPKRLLELPQSMKNVMFSQKPQYSTRGALIIAPPGRSRRRHLLFWTRVLRIVSKCSHTSFTHLRLSRPQLFWNIDYMCMIVEVSMDCLWIIPMDSDKLHTSVVCRAIWPSSKSLHASFTHLRVGAPRRFGIVDLY